MRRVNAMKRFVVMAIGAAILIGTGVFGVIDLAQTAQPAATQAPAASTPQLPPSAPTAATPVTPAPDASAVAPVAASTPQGGNIKGTVNASGVPLPGVGVTATNSVTGKKYATTTEIDGTFHLAVPTNARYVVSTDLTGFASATQEVVVSDTGQDGGLRDTDHSVQGGSRIASRSSAGAGGRNCSYDRRPGRTSNRSSSGSDRSSRR